MTRWLLALSLPVLLASHVAFATASANSPRPVSDDTHAVCELNLSTEFSHAPDDGKQGFITDKLPIIPQSIREAYARGIFPWSVTSEGMGEWFSPPERGILDITDVDIPRGDRKAIRKVEESKKYEIRVDTNFRGVITACAHQQRMRKRIREGKVEFVVDDRWITDDHIEQFTKLHEQGNAHSVEVWDIERNVMVGGLYGVFVNGYFSGESMFHDVPDVTKLAYKHLIERLKANGHKRIDIQQNVGINQKWGGRLIPRGNSGKLHTAEDLTFLKWLEEAKLENNPF